MPEMALFEDITGLKWDDDLGVVMDPEEKITEFNFEKFLSPEQLEGVDTGSAEFKKMIKIMNLKSKTKLEHLQECKEEFRKLMPQLSLLTPFE